MVSAEQQTFDALKASSALAALVGSGDQARIYPNTADQGVPTPYVIFERIGSQPVPYLDFAMSPEKVTIFVVCWADSRVLAGKVAVLVETAMREAFHMKTERVGDEVPALDESAEALTFEVWEL